MLLVLMAQARPVPNPELATLGPALDKPGRDKLNRLGLIASLSLSNTWRTRVTTQQDATDLAGSLRNNYQTLITDNRVVANALIGVGYEFGDNTIRWTNVYIHDTLKQARGGVGLGYVNAETIVRRTGPRSSRRASSHGCRSAPAP